MGNYNPRAPYILGEEWVPLREAPFSFPPLENDFEVGSTFTTMQPYLLDHACVYSPKRDSQPSGAAQFVQIYKLGQEGAVGPIQKVTLPVSAALVTGAPNWFFPAQGIVYGLAAGNNSAIQFCQPTVPVNSPTPQLSLYFPFNSYPVLQGKRIVKMQLRFWAWAYNSLNNGGPIVAAGNLTGVRLLNDITGAYDFHGGLDAFSDMPNIGPDAAGQPRVLFYPISDYWYQWTTPPSSSNIIPMPWQYSDLQKFEVTHPQRFSINIGLSGVRNAFDCFSIGFVELEVFYCNENRLMIAGGINNTVNLGANPVPFRTLDRQLNPLLPAGQYVITQSNGWSGSDALVFPFGASPWSALRELYSFPGHTGKQINLTQTEGETYEVVNTHVLPQISVHVSGGTIVEPHVYGDVINVPIYSGVTATQTILDQVVAGGSSTATYPWVRFYARRFGQTYEPLVLTGVNPQITGSSALLYPADLDALPEIIDGWREVTLRFGTIPTMGNIASPEPTWRFSSNEPFANNRWEILGLDAPAISGAPGMDYLTTVRTADLLDTATATVPVPIGPAGGSSTNLTWLAPPATGQTTDGSADAVLMFSVDPPVVTGFTVSTQSQALTGFTDCGSGPCCIPTALSYNKLQWGSIWGTIDVFNRIVASGSWGAAPNGQTWTLQGLASDFSVNGAGLISVSVVASSRFATISGAFADVDVSTRFTVGAIASTQPANARLITRWQNSSNYWQMRMQLNTSGTVDVQLVKIVAGVATFVGTAVNGLFHYDRTTSISARFKVQGDMFYAKAWIGDSSNEPDAWTIVYSEHEPALPAGGYGLTVDLASGNTNTLPYVFTVNDFNAQVIGVDHFEVQRMDDLDQVWRTVAKPSYAQAFFNDYEARVGITSRYQIRTVNELNFAGPWSVTGTGTITEPGATMPNCGTNKRGMLFFTSNEDQDGSSNLAYAMTFDQDNVETFGFVESGDITFMKQFDQDYQTMFHGTERGGETFTRRLLIANAAVPLPRLANVRSLRDLAWQDLSYVCVRDDIGDRWLASIIVSDNDVRRNRRLYNANITVVETTATPTQVSY